MVRRCARPLTARLGKWSAFRREAVFLFHKMQFAMYWRLAAFKE